MNSVPYAFCESVCGVLREIRVMNEMAGSGTNCKNWNQATKRIWERRLDVTIFIGHADREWSYEIKIRGNTWNNGRTISFQEFTKLDRQHIHVNDASIGSQFANRTSTSTLDEIAEIFKFTAPCVNLSFMMISERCTISEDDLSRLLSFYRNATFRQVCCYSQNRASEEFLIAQMQTNILKILSIEGRGWREELRSAIEEFSLNKDFGRISVLSPSLVFGRAFFDALVQKQLLQKRSMFESRFSFHSQELMTSGFQEVGGRFYGQEMRWIRQDGVSVTIEQSKYLSVELKHPLM